MTRRGTRHQIEEQIAELEYLLSITEQETGNDAEIARGVFRDLLEKRYRQLAEIAANEAASIGKRGADDR